MSNTTEFKNYLFYTSSPEPDFRTTDAVAVTRPAGGEGFEKFTFTTEEEPEGIVPLVTGDFDDTIFKKEGSPVHFLTRKRTITEITPRKTPVKRIILTQKDIFRQLFADLNEIGVPVTWIGTQPLDIQKKISEDLKAAGAEMVHGQVNPHAINIYKSEPGTCSFLAKMTEDTNAKVQEALRALLRQRNNSTNAYNLEIIPVPPKPRYPISP